MKTTKLSRAQVEALEIARTQGEVFSGGDVVDGRRVMTSGITVRKLGALGLLELRTHENGRPYGRLTDAGRAALAEVSK